MENQTYTNIPDRVFVKAITTIRALSSRSNYGTLPRPPAENRIRLYGLYKQATEGDVEGIMARPVGFTLEDEGAKKKWDAWKREEGLSKTESKRRYISYLIDTMKVYASGTLEARELLSELEYLWDQIKDLEFSPEDELDHEPHIQFPTHSPLFSQADQSDRYSTATPLPLPSNYSNSNARNNLQKIYSHSRRSTMLSINDYVQQQRQQQSHQTRGNNTSASVYSLPRDPHQPPGAGPDKLGHSIQSLPANAYGNQGSVEDFKNWQGEINLIINKLSREFLHKRNHHNRYSSPSESDLSESGMSPSEKLKRKLVQILRLLGGNLLKVFKSFSVSLLAILFLMWCIKKNVIVKRTLVKTPKANSNKQTEELVINMILNTDKNKWFIRMLSFVNSFVGFV